MTFERGDVPLTVALLVNASLSMAGEHLAVALRGVKSFVDAMAPLDEAMVVLFSDELLHATPFASDTVTLMEPLAGVAARGGTALNDYLYFALKKLEERQVLNELREQYVLGYYPTGALHDGSWHAVKVEVRGSGFKVRARDGYVDF